MLTIFVSRRKQGLIAADGSKTNVFRAYIRGKEGLVCLQHQEAFEKISSIRFVVKEWCRLRRLPRNANLEQGIATFLERYHAKDDVSFDCYAFANLVHGVPAHRCSLMCLFWDTRVYDGQVTMGDAVFLVNSEKSEFKHAALYLGRDLYISVYGGGGDLEITTLEAMTQYWKATQILVATPKKAVS